MGKTGCWGSLCPCRGSQGRARALRLGDTRLAGRREWGLDLSPQTGSEVWSGGVTGGRARQGVREPMTPGHLHSITWGLLDPPTAIQTRRSPALLRHTEGRTEQRLALTCPECPQKTPVGTTVTSQLEQKGVEAEPLSGLRRKRAGGALGPQGHPWGGGEHMDRLRPRLERPRTPMGPMLPGVPMPPEPRSRDRGRGGGGKRAILL